MSQQIAQAKASELVRKPLAAQASEAARSDVTHSVSQLRQSIGNRALQELLQPQLKKNQARGVFETDRAERERSTLARILERVPDAPNWAVDETSVRAIQRQLRRLGTYQLAIDGDYGRGTDSGLVEAFGGDEFRTLDAASILARLQIATPAAGRRGQHNLRYGGLFRDGVLDMTIGIGYDEALESNSTQELQSFRAVLETRGFVNDDVAAAAIYQQAGRAMPHSIADMYFVKRDALAYRPPAGAPRQIHAVVRLVSNTTGAQGAEAAQAFREGMVQSDVSYYAGHGRYGTGPDFDRNFASFALHSLDNPAQREPTILDYEVLALRLRQEIRQRNLGRSAWEQFLWRHRRGLLDVNFSNAGNVRINTRKLHAGEFGSNLINWALNEGHIRADTGSGGSLASAIGAHPERRYRVLVFDGCRTSDYETSLRTTPGLDRSSTHTIETTRTVFGSDDARTLAAFLDSILRQQSAEQIIRGMDDAQKAIRTEDRVNPRGTFVSHGTRSDPTIK